MVGQIKQKDAPYRRFYAAQHLFRTCVDHWFSFPSLLGELHYAARFSSASRAPLRTIGGEAYPPTRTAGVIFAICPNIAPERRGKNKPMSAKGLGAVSAFLPFCPADPRFVLQ